MKEEKVFENKNAIERFKAKLEKDRALDEKKERIPAHKIILAANSSVFHGMFYGEMKETGDIKIVDATPCAFLVFLKFFYFEPMVLNIENVGEIFYLADKYDATVCSTKCVEFLKETMKIENVCHNYELAILFDIKDLIVLCEKLISHETTAVLRTENFQNCARSALQRLLSIDCFSCNEATVFEACMHWAEMECKRNNLLATTVNRKQQLGACFNLIRFPSMDMNSLIACANSYPDLFRKDELEDLISHISDSRPLQVITEFNRIGRQLWIFLHCNRLSTNYQNCISTFDAVVFTANKTLLLEKISTQVITSRSGAEVSGTICIMKYCSYESATDEVQLLQSIDLKMGIQNHIVLEGPIIIEAKKIYEIKIHLKRNWNMYVPKRLLNRVVMNDGTEVKFKKSFNSPNASSAGLISDLFFKLNSQN